MLGKNPERLQLLDIDPERSWIRLLDLDYGFGYGPGEVSGMDLAWTWDG